jgi:hypothetical protein
VALTGLVERLEALASASAPLEQANQAIEAMRAQQQSTGRPAVSFEVVLPALDPEEFLRQRALPRLVYFLDCRGYGLPGGRGVFVSLFTPRGLFFIDAGTLALAVGEGRGLGAVELRRRYGQRGVGDPPLLGG